MLCRVKPDGQREKLQLSSHPQCALFSQAIVDGAVHVRYHAPPGEDAPKSELQDEVLEVPLRPDLGQLVREDVNVHQSKAHVYRMGSPYDEWFSACFGFETILLYIGDGRRPVLGTFSPRVETTQPEPASKGWLSSITSYVGSANTAEEGERDEPDWLTFSDCAPFLITTEASLANVSRRLESGDMEMVKFRPNIVIDGDGEWEEDFWAELGIRAAATAEEEEGETSGVGATTPTFALTKMCNRCSSVNVDYATGKLATGEHGVVLKKLMSDRRVDQGWKYAPVFGKYAFLADGVTHASLSVGDTVAVTRRSEQRPVWDWPMKSAAAARFYNQRV